MRRLALVLPFPGLPAHACTGEALLSCTAKSGAKAIDVCLEGDDFTYAYGPTGKKPELALRVPLTAGTLYPWQGFGRAISESIVFDNGGFRYEVSYSVDRLEENHPSDGSVYVTKSGQEVAFIACDPGSVTVSLFAAQDAMTALGLCWNSESEGWTGTCP